MPYDSNGNYTLPAIYKAKPATTIMTEQHNNPLEDIQVALNSVLLRNGSAPMTGPLNMGINKVINLADGVANTDAATVGQALILQKASSQKVTGDVEFSGETLVPSVSDWTQQQALGASDADGRYAKSIADSGNYRIVAMGVNASSGVPWFSANGSFYNVQAAGDYATNIRLSSIEENLNSSKVNRSGDTLTGTLNINVPGGGVLLSGNGGGDNVPGGVGYSAGLQSAPSVGATPRAIYRFINVNGIGPFATIWLTGNDGSAHELRFGADDRLRTASGNVFALTSEIPTNVAKLSDLPLDAGKIILTWNGTVTGDASIPFPRTLSSVDTVIVCASRQTDGNQASSIINTQDWNNGSVHVNAVYAGAGLGTATVNYRALVIGNK